jgi:hypothetical protein
MLPKLRQIPEQFEFYSPEEIPKNRDCFLQSAKDELIIQTQWIEWLDNHDPNTWKHPNWVVKYMNCWVQETNESFINLSFMVKNKNRFHSANILLPRTKLKASFLPWTAEKKSYIIVDDRWFERLLSYTYSLYCVIDFINIRNLISENGEVPAHKLNEIQQICKSTCDKHEELQLIMLADNILLKSSWKPEEFEKYNPENFISLVNQTMISIEQKTNIGSYAIFTQGASYVNEDKVDIIKSDNFVSIPSISAPFIESFEIDTYVRKQIREGSIKPKSLYIETSLYLSTNRKFYSSEEPKWFKKYDFFSEKSLKKIEFHALEYNEFIQLIE